MGGKQLGFSDYEQTTAKKRTKKEKFLAEMDQVVPWQPLLDLIEPPQNMLSVAAMRCIPGLSFPVASGQVQLLIG